MDTESTEMHRDFSDWMRSADLGTDRDALQNRWTTINRIIYENGLAQNKKDQLIRYIFLGKAPTKSLEWIQSEFKEDDDIFSMNEEHNRNELFALTAIVLGLLMDDNGRSGAITGTRILTSICGRNRLPKGSTPLFDLAKQEVKRYAFSIRQRTLKKDRKTPQWPENEISTAISAVQPNNPATFQAAITAISAPIKRVVTNLKDVNEDFEILEDTILLQDEELNLLWWIINGYSEKLNVRLDTLNDGLLPLICGIEVAERISTCVEPPSLKALLSRGGLDAVKKIKLFALLKDVPEDIECLVIDVPACPVITPVQYAIECLKDIGKNSWQEKWERETGLKSNIELSPLEWAVQICRERLVLGLMVEE